MIFQTISVQILTLFNLFFVMRKNKFYHLYFLENARAYQIIKYHFKLNGENHVSAECIFYYTVVKLANDQVIVLFACQKCFNYRAGGTRGAGGAFAPTIFGRYIPLIPIRKGQILPFNYFLTLQFFRPSTGPELLCQGQGERQARPPLLKRISQLNHR